MLTLSDHVQADAVSAAFGLALDIQLSSRFSVPGDKKIPMQLATAESCNTRQGALLMGKIKSLLLH